jgi:phage terminase large subunit GpA-like protein
VDEILAAWRDGLKPDPALKVSEWADRHRLLSPRASAEPGRYRTERTPYMREIMDALSPLHPARRIVVMKSAQIGFTEAGNNWIGYVIHHAPGPMLAVQPTVELAKRFSRQRIDTLIAESPALRGRVRPARSRDAGNTLLAKEFPGGILVLTGANSAVGLRSMPVRYLFLDEVDAYPPSADDEGDPVALAEARTRTFSWRSKVLLGSTPTIQGLSRIEREFEASDQRRYFVPCPHCGHRQWLRFERLRWEKGRPETACYVCELCEGRIEEHHKAWFLRAGEWRATAAAREPGTIGFHISGLYVPPGWSPTWAEIAAAWESAQTDEARRAIRNGMLGETWAETGDAPDWQRLYERREAWPPGVVPAGGLFLTAGADVQKDRIEVSVWAWGRGLESWLVEHAVLAGGPERPECWQALSHLLGRTWPQAHGRARLAIARLGIDTGYETAAVYAWARQAGFAQVAPVKGIEGFSRAAPVLGPSYVDATEGGKKIRRGARLWTVASATFKSETYRWLRLSRPVDEEAATGAVPLPGYVHLPDWLDAEFVKQLVAEQLVTVKTRRGFTRLEWQKVRERNEALDCRVYARAAAWIAGADRWPEGQWQDLESQVRPEDLEAAAPLPSGIVSDDVKLVVTAPAGNLRPRRPPSIRILTPNYMRGPR